MKHCKSLFSLFVLLFSVAIGRAQSTAPLSVITSSYNELTVTHTLVKLPDGKYTVFCKFKNNQYTSDIGVVISVTPSSGAPRKITLVVEPGAMLTKNVGEMKSFTLATVKITPQEKQVNSWVLNARDAEIVSRVGEKLFSKLIFDEDKKVVVNQKNLNPKIFDIRVVRNSIEGNLVNGTIYLNGEEIGAAYERNDMKIPTGVYKGTIRMTSQKGHAQGPLGRMSNSGDFLINVKGVPGSPNILFHGGSTPGGSEGCIMLGPVVRVAKYDGYIDANHPLMKLRLAFYETDKPVAYPDKDIVVTIAEESEVQPPAKTVTKVVTKDFGGLEGKFTLVDKPAGGDIVIAQFTNKTVDQLATVLLRADDGKIISIYINPGEVLTKQYLSKQLEMQVLYQKITLPRKEFNLIDFIKGKIREQVTAKEGNLKMEKSTIWGIRG